MTVLTGTPMAAAFTTLLTLEAKSTSPVSSPFIAMSDDITTNFASMPSSLKYPRYFANSSGAADISLGEERENTAGRRVWPNPSEHWMAEKAGARNNAKKKRNKFLVLLRVGF